MRRTVLLALLLGCSSGQPIGGGVAETVTVKARGLYLGPSDFQTPDGAMTVADDVVISRDGIVETRRGLAVIGTKALTRIFPFKGAFVGHGGTTLASSTDGVTWLDYQSQPNQPMVVSPPSGAAMRSADASANLFLTSSAGLYRIDVLTVAPELAGVPEGLDVELALAGAGTAIPTATQVAYRLAFGKKDANGRLLLGAPSGRAVISNAVGTTQNVTVGATLPRGLGASHFYQAYRSASAVAADDELGLVYEAPVPITQTATQLARLTNVVTVSATAHGYSTGMIVRVSPGGSAPGYLIAVGTSLVAKSTAGTTWTTGTIPAGDYYDAAWNGSVWAAVGLFSLAATSPDGITWTARTISAGDYQAIAWGAGVFVAIGNNVATSPDGITWTDRSGTSGSYQSIVWTGNKFVAVSANAGSGTRYATSPDGITWTEGTIGAGSVGGESVAYSGSKLVTVDVGSSAVSTDGTTWTTNVVTGATDLRGVCWTGSLFVAVGGNQAFTSPDGVTWTSRTMAAGTFNACAWDGSNVIAVGNSVAATSPDGITWTARTIDSGVWRAVASGGAAIFTPGEKTITGVAANTFTYSETGADGTLNQNQTVDPLSVTFTDTVPDGFLGATLYSSPNQEGILNANARPLIAKDIAVYQGSLFEANVTTPAYGTASYLGGMSNGDTVTINGLVHTAAAAESIAARQFKLFTAGTVSENIRDTAASLIRVVNRSLTSGVTAQYVSGEDDPPGAILFTVSDSVTSLVVTFSRTTSWSPAAGLSVAPRAYVNGLVWTKTDQPDHVPKSLWLVPQRIGSNDKAILRVLPTRSSLFILKEDGVWRLTGGAGVWDISPFDPTVRLVAPESAIVLDNTIFALTEAGVVRISDTGTALMSRQPGVCDIEPALQGLLAPALRSATTALAFGVAYESDHKYILWLPELSSDTKGTQAYVYDLFTRTWTRWTPDAAHGFVNPADDRLYFVDGVSMWQERKAFAASDLADRSYVLTVSSGGGTASIVVADASNVAVGDVVSGNVSALVTAISGSTLTLNQAGPANGAATLYKAISTVITWAPKFGRSPAAWTELQAVQVLWDSVAFDTCSLAFSTDIVTTPEAVTLRASDYGWTWAARSGQVEVWPPRDVSVGSRFLISLSHRQAWSPNAVAGLAVSFKSNTWRVGR